MIRVAIDASSAATGGGISYLRHILPRLTRHDMLEVGPILARVERPQVAAVIPPELHVVPASGRLAARSRTWHEVVKNERIDVVFAPTEISFCRYDIPLVLAFRNSAIFDGSLHRDYRRHERVRFRIQQALTKLSARHASSHIAVSAYARDAATSLLGIEPERIHIVRHGGPIENDRYRPRSPRPVRRLLVVSSLYRWKNVDRLLRCLRQVRGEWSLDIVGDMPEKRYGQEVNRLIDSMRSRVTFHGYLTGQSLEEMYQRADCLIWPSYGETFGHPLLEAHAHGLPLLVARACSNEEIAGSSPAYYFDPFDELEIITVLQKSIGTILPCGPLPRKYDWDACATHTGDILTKAAQAR